MEESCATKVALEEDLRLAAEELAPGGVDQATSMSGKGVLARAAYEGLDDDLLAATEYLKEPLTNVPEPPAPVPSSTVLTGSEASSSKQITARSSAGETRR